MELEETIKEENKCPLGKQPKESMCYSCELGIDSTGRNIICDVFKRKRQPLGAGTDGYVECVCGHIVYWDIQYPPDTCPYCGRTQNEGYKIYDFLADIRGRGK